MESLTSNQAAICEAVQAQIATIPLERIVGQPTNTTVNRLKAAMRKTRSLSENNKLGRFPQMPRPGHRLGGISIYHRRRHRPQPTAWKHHHSPQMDSPTSPPSSTKQNSTQNTKSSRSSTGNRRPSTESPSVACQKTSSTQPTSRSWRTNTSAMSIKLSRLS